MIHASLRAVVDPTRAVDHDALEEAQPRGTAAPRAQDLRAEALWKTAPWFAGLSVLCAGAVAWIVRGTVAPLGTSGWLAAILCINWVSVRVQRRVVNYPLTRMGRWPLWAVGGVSAHAVIWATLPVLVFAAQPPAGQILIAAAIATLIAGAFLIALAPIAAAVWATLLAGALLWMARSTADGYLPVLTLLAIGYLGIVLGGCLTVERLLSRYMDMAARERARRDAITLLLKEYEDQGAGWLWQIDAFGLFTYVSPRIAGLVGRAPAQMLGLPIGAVLGGPRLSQALAAREGFQNLELQVNTPDGQRWVSVSGNPIVGSGGSFHGFRGVGMDVTEAHRSQERLTQMASNDVLTGLPNRQSMRHHLADAVQGAERDGHAAAIMFLDLDGFKPVNDRFGHPIGDAVLRGVAQRLANAVGERGRVGRVGGDEFALVLHDGSCPRAVEELAHALIAAASAPFAFDQGEVRIGLSVGCAFAPADGTSVEELLLKADLALYEAKSRGRGTFRRFRPEMQRAADRRAGLEHDLRQALRERQLSLHYQPVLSSDTYEIRGFEALLRWHHPDRGLIEPAAFLGIAEETGIIGDIGAWVLRTACCDAAAWPAPLFVSVNVSDRQLAARGFSDAVGDALAAGGLSSERLHLEIPEQVFLGGGLDAIEVLRRVRRTGVQLSLDNFGVGHAALGHVATNLFDTLKIDGRFLRAALGAEDTTVMVHAIVAVAESFRMHVVAERIEEKEELAQVGAIGCDRFQGFLAAPPMPFSDTELLLRAGTRALAETA
jgi:diguanylate cyclase (GGDEF)-like protein